MTKTLNIIEGAYRATLEEQDDTVVWITAAMRKAGAPIDVLLTGNAVNYAVEGQNAGGLRLGTWEQTQPPRLARDVEELARGGATVYVLADDAAERGLEATDLSSAVTPIARTRLADLVGRYERVWHW